MTSGQRLTTQRLQTEAFLLPVVLLLCATLLAGCSMTKEPNRRLLNELDRQVRIESPAARVAWAPVMIPAGTVAVALDTAVVHPVAVVPVCVRDIKTDFRMADGANPHQVLLYKGAFVVAAPAVFAVHWTGRIVLPVDDH